jgi:capsular polysaccharide biosynthesis protein
MRNLAIGFVLGIVVATVGFSGVARILDNGIGAVKSTSKELAQ